MTLDEAIAHCEEKAKTCNACGLEHKQLAEWLKELKSAREKLERQADQQIKQIIIDFKPANNLGE